MQSIKNGTSISRIKKWSAIFLLVALPFLGLLAFGGNLYNFPANPDPLTLPKDSVVICLAGGKHRIEAAFSLFADGVGDRLYIIGAGKKATAAALSRIQATRVAQKISWDRFDKIQVESESRNTIENAFVVKRFLNQAPEAKTVVLVTSSYHMRRALFILSLHLPSNIHVIPYTPLVQEIDRDSWWQSGLGISVTAEEYFKFLMVKMLLPWLS